MEINDYFLTCNSISQNCSICHSDTIWNIANFFSRRSSWCIIFSIYQLVDGRWQFSSMVQENVCASCQSHDYRCSSLSFFDGHHSHITLRLVEVARGNNIHLICFPPHATYILQPLDLGVFGTVLKKFQIATCAANVTKEFPSLLSNLLEISFSPDHIKGGLRKLAWAHLAEVIPQLKFDKALPFAKHPEDSTQEERECISVNLVTPIRLRVERLLCYFATKK